MERQSAEVWSSLQIFIIISASLLVSAAVIGNGLVIASWLFYKKIRTPSNFLLVSLAFTDFLVATLTTPLASLQILDKSWIFNGTTCQFFLTVVYVLYFVSSNHLVLIAIDRYRIIKEGVPYLQTRSVQNTLRHVCALWIIGFILNSPTFFDWEGTHIFVENSENTKGVCTIRPNTYFVGIIVFDSYLVPFILQVLLYYCVIVLLRRKIWQQVGGLTKSSTDLEDSGNQLNSMRESSSTISVSVSFVEKEQQRKVDCAIRKERKASSTLGFLILAYSISWTPYFLLFMFLLIGAKTPGWFQISVPMLIWLNACVNPLIYVWRHADFQEAFSYVVRKICFCYK